MWNEREDRVRGIKLNQAALATLAKGEHRARMRAEVGGVSSGPEG